MADKKKTISLDATMDQELDAVKTRYPHINSDSAMVRYLIHEEFKRLGLEVIVPVSPGDYSQAPQAIDH